MLKNYIVLILFYIVLSDQNIIVLYIYGGILHSQNECKITRIFNHRGYIVYIYIYMIIVKYKYHNT